MKIKIKHAYGTNMRTNGNYFRHLSKEYHPVKQEGAPVKEMVSCTNPLMKNLTMAMKLFKFIKQNVRLLCKEKAESRYLHYLNVSIYMLYGYPQTVHPQFESDVITEHIWPFVQN